MVEYSVGRFTLRPRRQLLAGDAPVAIGRKALDLLSTLAEAQGALVTKDELMAAVWPKAIVEENAIQVHIAALRKVLGEDAELLSTVRGLGYRLTVSPPAAAPFLQVAPDSPTTEDHPDRAVRPPSTGRDRKLVAIAGGLLAVALVFGAFWGFGAWTQPDSGSRAAVIAVTPFQSHGSARVRDLSEGLVAATIDALSNTHLEVASGASARTNRAAPAGPRPDPPQADFRLTGAVWEAASSYDVYVHLDDVRRNVVLWSDTFRGALSAPSALQASVAAHLADAALWAGVGRAGRVRLDPAALAAFIAGREATIGVRGDAAALNDYRAVVAASPNFSWGHSAIAVTQGFDLTTPPAPANASILIAEARREAQRALALDPHNGEAYLALELAAPPLDWRGREDLLIRGVAADPNFEPLAMMEGRLLWFVGRNRDAARWLERAHDLDHLHNGTTWSLAVNLASGGRSSSSRTLLTQMLAQWPEHDATKLARFWTSVVSGTTAETLALLADPATWPSEMDRTAAEAWRGALNAVHSNASEDKARAVSAVVDAVALGSMDHGEAMILLSRLGDLDGSFAQAQLFDPGHLFAPAYLSLPLAAAMRADRRFIALARKLGLVAYWRSSGHWPDFCSEPTLPYDCRAEAAIDPKQG